MSLIERCAEAYGAYYGFLGADTFEEMEPDDRARCREVARTILQAANHEGAVEALRYIANLDRDHLVLAPTAARDELRAMGVDFTTPQGGPSDE